MEIVERSSEPLASLNANIWWETTPLVLVEPASLAITMKSWSTAPPRPPPPHSPVPRLYWSSQKVIHSEISDKVSPLQPQPTLLLFTRPLGRISATPWGCCS